MQNSFAIKKYLNRTVFFGVLAAAVAFVVAMYQPKQYLVVGKMVVFPAGLASAEKNLGYEVGNTVQILNSAAFKSDTYQGLSGNFAYAKQLGSSSTIAVAFYVQKNQQIAIEDTVVRFPSALADYARDLYSGSPFKYRLLSDPEISAGPVKPDLARFLGIGFLAGAILYFLYWLLFEFLRIPQEKEKGIETAPESVEETNNDITDSVGNDIGDVPAIAKIGAGTIELIDGKPAFRPGEIAKTSSGSEVAPKIGSTVPENLPVAGGEIPPLPQSEEPTDEEVKERLNRLMRGEL